MTKPKITREQERVFLEVADGYSKQEAVGRFWNFKSIDSWKVKLKDIDFDLFLEVLVNDYEIKKSPEQKLLELYNYHLDNVSSYSDHYLDGMMDTLHTLGIKIEGIEF